MGRARSSKCRCLSGKGDPARGSFLFSQSLSSTELHSAPLRKLVREESQSCTTSRPERPLRQGTTPARPATLGLEQAYVGPWAPLPEMGPPLRQSGNLGVLVTSHGHTPLFGDPLAFLGNLRKEEGRVLHTVFLLITEETSPSWGREA